MSEDKEYGFRESVVMTIGTLTDAVQYWYNPRDSTNKAALGALERARSIIDETIEEFADEVDADES